MPEIIRAGLLKTLRKGQSTQEKLADLADILQSTLVKYEIGAGKISKDIDTI